MKSSKCNSVWNSNLSRCVHLIGKSKSTTANMRKSNTSHGFIPLSDSFKQTNKIYFFFPFHIEPARPLASNPDTLTHQSIHTHKAPMRKLLLMIPIAMYFPFFSTTVNSIHERANEQQLCSGWQRRSFGIEYAGSSSCVWIDSSPKSSWIILAWAKFIGSRTFYVTRRAYDRHMKNSKINCCHFSHKFIHYYLW